MRKTFDILKDTLIGNFFCNACLLGKPVEQQSEDSRYCQSCLESMHAAVDSDSMHRPRVQRGSLNQENNTGKRRRRGKVQSMLNVTVEKVTALTAEGLSTRKVGRELGCSHMTVARILKGQAVLE